MLRLTSGAPFALLVLLASSGFLASCSSKSNDAPGTTPDAAETGVGAMATFTPKGCGFTVGAIDGFPTFDAHVDVIGKSINDGKNDYGP